MARRRRLKKSKTNTLTFRLEKKTVARRPWAYSHFDTHRSGPYSRWACDNFAQAPEQNPMPTRDTFALWSSATNKSTTRQLRAAANRRVRHFS